MRIVFVQNILLDSDAAIQETVFQPHLGLISLIAVAEGAGHECALYDPMLALAKGELVLDNTFYYRIAEEILKFDPDVVGLTSLGCNFICTVKAAAYLKAANPELPILLGGPHATVLDREIIKRFPQFDVIVRNEAELKILPLLESLPKRQFNNIPGITYRCGNDIIATPGDPVISDLDALAWPAYDHYPIGELNLTSLRVEAGRGCPFKCTFCSTASFFGRKYRLKSPERLRAELDYLNSKYSISRFALQHDLFTVNRAKVVDFCEVIKDRGYTWTCSARMDCVDAELLERMYDAGCRSIYYGVETGSARLQKVVEKHLDLSLFSPILDVTQRLKMEATVSFITGYPQEEQSDQDDTLDLIGTCFRRSSAELNVQLHLLTPEPGTGLILKYADALDYDGHISDFNFPTLEADDAEIIRQNPEVFMTHHYYRSVLPRRQHIFVTSINHVFYKLGESFMAHLLDYYEGKLSRLVRRMHRWAEETEAQPPFDNAFVLAFFENEWGQKHYLTSIARYMLAASQLLRQQSKIQYSSPALTEEKPATLRKDYSYALTHQAIVLRDLHNTPEILRFLSEKRQMECAEVPEPLSSQMGHYLLFLDNPRNGDVRNFVLNEASADLIEYFSQSRSYQDCLSYFDAVADDADSSRAFFEELLRIDVLRALNTRDLVLAQSPSVEVRLSRWAGSLEKISKSSSRRNATPHNSC